MARLAKRGRIVVNADDFGASRNINAAIVEAFEGGLISSATIMANMPSFTEACALAKLHGFDHRIGLHLNFTYGKPLTVPISECARFCRPDGEWLPPRRIGWVNRKEASALETEISAQIQACALHGIVPTHLDSHHQMHVELGLIPLIVRSARRHGVPAIRTAFNCVSDRAGRSSAYRAFGKVLHCGQSAYLRWQGLAKTDYCGDARDVSAAVRIATAHVEVMVHPMLDSFGRLVDIDGEDLRTRLDLLGISTDVLCGYSELTDL